MTPEFYKEYLEAKPKKKQILYINNPNKFITCQQLVRYHERKGDKIIIFSDNIFALEMYGKYLGRPYIHGGVSDKERLGIFNYF